LIIALERYQRRFFCRNFCPLGATLGVVAQKCLLVGEGGNEECRSCRLCSRICRMGAIDETRQIDMASCNFCYECVQKCPRQIIAFRLGGGWRRPAAVSLRRRRFLLAACAGGVLPLVQKNLVSARYPDPLLIRPPGALAERDFLQRCVRCGECMQVCIGNVLQPAAFEAGFDGMFSPVVKSRSGYCEFNCTLCGQVCPTGAITTLSREEKQRLKIGNAFFAKDLCLPYAKGIPCMVCEEHCPTPEKAIRFRPAEVINAAGEKVNVKQPYVIDELCIGCGICENKCPLPGRAAIYVTSAGEARHPERALPSLPDFGGNYGGYSG
jgi:ferredoxin